MFYGSGLPFARVVRQELVEQVDSSPLERRRAGSKVEGLGFRAQGLGFRVQGSGFRVQGWISGSTVEGLESRVQDLRSRF
jgi:hypothetical protein